jgi:Flp pilus assembly protein TadD
MQGHDAAQAARWFRVATALAPDQAEGHFRLGALLLANRSREALEPLETAVRLDPRHAAARRSLAFAFAILGRFDQARVQGEEALRLDPADAQLRAFLKSLPPAGRR